MSRSIEYSSHWSGCGQAPFVAGAKVLSRQSSPFSHASTGSFAAYLHATINRDIACESMAGHKGAHMKEKDKGGKKEAG